MAAFLPHDRRSHSPRRAHHTPDEWEEDDAAAYRSLVEGRRADAAECVSRYNTHIPPLPSHAAGRGLLLGVEEEDDGIGYRTVGYGTGLLLGAHVDEDEEDKYANPRYGLPEWIAPLSGAAALPGHTWNVVQPPDDESEDNELACLLDVSPGRKPPPPSPAVAMNFALPPSLEDLSPCKPLTATPVIPNAPQRPPSVHSVHKSLATQALEKRFDEVVDLRCHEVADFLESLIDELVEPPHLPPRTEVEDRGDVEDDLVPMHRSLSVKQTNLALGQLAPQAIQDTELGDEGLCGGYRSVRATPL